MKNPRIKKIFFKLILFSLLTMAITVNAFQNVPLQPAVNNNSNVSSSSNSINSGIESNSNMSDSKSVNPANDNRVIRVVTGELLEDDSCVDCSAAKAVQTSGFPAYALLAIGGGALTPFLFNGFTNNAPTGPIGDVSPTQP